MNLFVLLCYIQKSFWMMPEKEKGKTSSSQAVIIENLTGPLAENKIEIQKKNFCKRNQYHKIQIGIENKK